MDAALKAHTNSTKQRERERRTFVHRLYAVCPVTWTLAIQLNIEVQLNLYVLLILNSSNTLALTWPVCLIFVKKLWWIASSNLYACLALASGFCHSCISDLVWSVSQTWTETLPADYTSRTCHRLCPFWIWSTGGAAILFFRFVIELSNDGMRNIFTVYVYHFFAIDLFLKLRG